ncbi:hypothetical protein ACFZB6_26755 [Streptomyces syringium]|uniref:hypothetical protein n=1 Tax=Streptomyces syringium TaxID=76729 RepID=UPI0036F113E5
MSELVDVLGTGEGCPVCDDAGPFTSDAQAVEHISTHDPSVLAWSLLKEKAFVQRILLEVDEPGGITSEDEIDDLFKQVELIAHDSPARPAP